MCGIFAVFNHKGGNIHEFRPRALDLSKKLRHRGPDWNGMKIIDNHVIAHERLAIIDLDSGAQPLTDVEGKVVLTVNGEIYNHLALREQLKDRHTFLTHSDCEVILHMYKEEGPKLCSKLDGMFSFVLFDGEHFMAARDPVGITTLYMGWGEGGSIWFASEMKSLNEECEKIIAFPPGHYYHSKDAKLTRYYNPVWFDETFIPSNPLDLTVLRTTLEKAVIKRMMSDVPFGVLLSGGLDSSLIASIASRHTEKMAETGWGTALHSFSIGLPGSPDLLAARDVAAFLGTRHHEYTFTVQDGLDALSDVVYHLETYDVTTIRASTPMYLLSRKIKAMGVKMVLSGEGSDEVFGGYLYFFNAPNPSDFHVETVRRVKNLHLADNLRANKSTMAWGLEARVPFLDKDFLDVAMTIDPAEKIPLVGKRMEKYILRKAFDTPERPYLPEKILWRQKEQFSDGVGYSWIDSLRDMTSSMVSDEELGAAAERFPYDTPQTKEAYFYRALFERHFPQHPCLLTVMRWIPRQDWGCPADPSGRAQKVHEKAYVASSSESGESAESSESTESSSASSTASKRAAEDESDRKRPRDA